jgi:hypothetical protein
VCGSAQGARPDPDRVHPARCRPQAILVHRIRPENREIAPIPVGSAPLVRNLPKEAGEGTPTVAQRIIEMLIGRLITDEAFREAFSVAPERTLLELVERGLDLSKTEIAALVSTNPEVWARAADALDPRLQKVSLTGEARMS